jgi:hypothetical protein
MGRRFRILPDCRKVSKVPVRRGRRPGPELEVNRTELVQIRTAAPESPKLGADQTCLGRGRDGKK